MVKAGLAAPLDEAKVFRAEEFDFCRSSSSDGKRAGGREPEAKVFQAEEFDFCRSNSSDEKGAGGREPEAVQKSQQSLPRPSQSPEVKVKTPTTHTTTSAAASAAEKGRNPETRLMRRSLPPDLPALSVVRSLTPVAEWKAPYSATWAQSEDRCSLTLAFK